MIKINGLKLERQIDETLTNLRQHFDPSNLTKEERKRLLQQIEATEKMAHDILAKSKKSA